MKNILRGLSIVALAVPVLLVLSMDAHTASYSGIGVDPGSYPSIGREEMGQLRLALSMANAPLDDFSMIGWDPAGGDGYGYRYTIAFTDYFLALEQYHKAPAWTERIQPAMDRLIRKMIEKPVWEYWATISRGLPKLEPLLNRPYPEAHDPVADKNIMYSGHLGHMIGLYETLYRDMKWDEPGSIVFAWSKSEKYVYDNGSLQRVMYKQMKDNPWNSIACEPNAVFPSCNQHPVLSFMLYDYLHGTDLAEVSDSFLEFFLEHRMIDPLTHHAAAYYLIKQHMTLSGGQIGISASMDGWVGAFMHAWQPDYIERQYPYMKRDQVLWEGDDGARLRVDYGPGQSLKYGYFGLFAAEVGDLETRDKLMRTADDIYLPRWQDGAYVYYPAGADKTKIEPMPLTGKVIACARADVKNGLFAMHNHPFDDAHFSEPGIEGVDFPSLLITRAIYDRDKAALVVSTEPGEPGSGSSSFKAVRLDPVKSYRLLVDGSEVRRIEGRSSVEIEVGLDRAHDLVLAQM